MASPTQNLAVGVPDLSAERAVTWPKRTKAKLSNGLEVILAEAHSIPKFHGELFFALAMQLPCIAAQRLPK